MCIRDRKLQIAGLSEGWNDTHVLHDAEGAVDTVLVFRAGRLIAVETVNQAGRHMAARKLLVGPPLLRETLAAAGWDLRAVLAAAG